MYAKEPIDHSSDVLTYGFSLKTYHLFIMKIKHSQVKESAGHKSEVANSNTTSNQKPHVVAKVKEVQVLWMWGREQRE